MFVLFTLNNEEVAGSEAKRVYRVDADQSDEDYLDELATDLVEEANSLFGIKVGTERDGVEVTGYSCNWKLLEDMSEDEIDEIYGAIWEV